jgi:hypothetical protein
MTQVLHRGAGISMNFALRQLDQYRAQAIQARLFAPNLKPAIGGPMNDRPIHGHHQALKILALIRLLVCAPLFALFLATSTSVAADGDDELYRAASLYWDGDTVQAVEIWRRLAEDGSAIAACNIGVVHQRGEGVPANPAEAMRWYRVAADRDDVEAQYRLGLMYLRGEGVGADEQEAHRWFTLRRAHHAHHHHTPQMEQWRREAAALIWQQEMHESLAASLASRDQVLADLKRRAGLSMDDAGPRLSEVPRILLSN